MEFPNIVEETCPTSLGGDDGLPESPDCTDADFARDNPGLCPVNSRLVLGPERAGACLGTGTAIQYRTFLSSTTITELTTGVTYSSSDESVVAINATTGEAAIVGVGTATITATYTTLTASASVTVLSGDDCCSLVTTTNAVLVDNSKSMSNPFDGTYPSLVSLAKNMATAYMGELVAGVDNTLLYSFNTGLTQRTAVTDIQATESQTDLKTSVEQALAILNAATTEKKVLLIFTDGANRPKLNLADQDALVDACMEFKLGGGIIICIGLRAITDGFYLLKLLASGGFFINVNTAPATAIEQMNALRQMVCLPTCESEGTVNLIPAMTGPITPGGSVSASSDDGTNLAWEAVDGNNNTVWNQQVGAALPQYLIYQFAQARKVWAYSLIGSGQLTTPKAWLLEGSNDGLNWTELDSQDGSFAQGVLHRFELAEVANYSYYRLYVTEAAGVSSYGVSLAVLELHGCKLGVFGVQAADSTPLTDLEK